MVPTDLERLLDAADETARVTAWDAFVTRYSRLLLHTARLVMPSHDGAMDAYAHLLERLRRDDFRALRIYKADDQTQFTTWLAVVARRMCVDLYRQKYGRPRGNGKSVRVEEARLARWRLVNFAPSATELTQIVDGPHTGPEAQLRHAQLQDALDAAVGDLGADDRLLLRLRFEDDLSARTIASVLALPSAFHVYRRLRAVCAELRLRLTERGVESSAP